MWIVCPHLSLGMHCPGLPPGSIFLGDIFQGFCLRCLASIFKETVRGSLCLHTAAQLAQGHRNKFRWWGCVSKKLRRKSKTPLQACWEHQSRRISITVPVLQHHRCFAPSKSRQIPCLFSLCKGVIVELHYIKEMKTEIKRCTLSMYGHFLIQVENLGSKNCLFCKKLKNFINKK